MWPMIMKASPPNIFFSENSPASFRIDRTLSAAGKLFLEDARRILQQVSEAALRAARVARGQSGTLRIGLTENASWQGVVPDSFR